MLVAGRRRQVQPALGHDLDARGPRVGLLLAGALAHHKRAARALTQTCVSPPPPPPPQFPLTQSHPTTHTLPLPPFPFHFISFRSSVLMSDVASLALQTRRALKAF